MFSSMITVSLLRSAGFLGFVVASAHCSQALRRSVPKEDFGHHTLARGDGREIPESVPQKKLAVNGSLQESTWVATELANPAGCARVSRADAYKHLELTDGVFPLEDFREMLSHEKAVRDGGPDVCKSVVANTRWCPEPTAERFAELENEELHEYVMEALAGVDRSKPLVIAVWDGSDAASSKTVQLANFVCGWERLGLIENRSAIVTLHERTATLIRQLHPKVRVLYHRGIKMIMDAITQRTGLRYANRVAKLSVSSLLVHKGFDLILSDLDIFWVRDPTPVFQEAADRDGLEFAAMKDLCWLELNSGFLYYRASEATKQMLMIAVSTEREADLGFCADNDQYLLNCGFARAALAGLKYKILPHDEFAFGQSDKIGGKMICHPGEVQPRPSPSWLGDGLPYVWHTSGYSGRYDRELDMFATFGLIDVDVHTRTCKAGFRGTDEDARRLMEKSKMSCSVSFGGILHNGCFGDCQTESSKARELVEAWKSDASP